MTRIYCRESHNAIVFKNLRISMKESRRSDLENAPLSRGVTALGLMNQWLSNTGLTLVHGS